LRPRPLSFAAQAAILLAFGAALIARTWMTWLNPFVDGSRELNLPARIAGGEHLYSQVVAHYGPVPVWLHAVAYRALGLRLSTPLALLVPAAIVTFASLFLLAARAASPLVATWGAALGIAIALVAPNGGALVFPYSFAAAHSLALASAALAVFTLGGTTRWLAALLWGLALASKPEYAVASMGAAVLSAGASGVLGRDRRRALALCASAAAIALLVYAVAFRGIRVSTLTLEGPLAIFHPPKEWNNVYRRVSGLDDVSGSLQTLCTAAALVLLVLALLYAADRLHTSRPGLAIALAALTTLLTVTFLAASEAGIAVDRFLPPLLAVAPLAFLVLSALREGSTVTGRAALALYAFAGLGAMRVVLKMTYGHVATPYASLAAPALAAAAAVALWRAFPRIPAVCAILFGGLVVLQAIRIYAQTDGARYAMVETPRGTLRLPVEKGIAVRSALRFLKERGPGSLTVFPEGGLLNFALARPNPLRQEQILPGHLDAAAETRVVEAIRSPNGPRHVILANQPFPLYEAVAFGKDYAQGVWGEVLTHYRLVAVLGPAAPTAPIGDPRFFLRIYERRPAEPTDSSPARVEVSGGDRRSPQSSLQSLR
jgi:hypothetical protein